MENRNACWSCGQPGATVGGHAWLRKCEKCDVRWDAQPPGSADERDRVRQRERRLDLIAEKFGLGNREGFVDHGAVKLPTVA